VRYSKAEGLPVVIVRGVRLDPGGEGGASELVMPPGRDLFR
jgi:F420-0:gamma-glutamyl ligase